MSGPKLVSEKARTMEEHDIDSFHVVYMLHRRKGKNSTTDIYVKLKVFNCGNIVLWDSTYWT